MEPYLSLIDRSDLVALRRAGNILFGLSPLVKICTGLKLLKQLPIPRRKKHPTSLEDMKLLSTESDYRPK
jgi:hypothetical protein